MLLTPVYKCEHCGRKIKPLSAAFPASRVISIIKLGCDLKDVLPPDTPRTIGHVCRQSPRFIQIGVAKFVGLATARKRKKKS